MFGGTSQDRGSPLGRSLNRPTQYGKHLSVAGSAACAMAFFALTVVLGTANQAWAGKRHRHSQPTPVTDAGTACGGSITPSTLFMGTANTGPFEVGNTVTVNAVILNTNPVNFVVTNVVDELSCIEIPSPFNFFTCNSSFSSGPDDDSISYAANIQTDCGVTWNADTSVAGVVTFTPATTLTLSPGASCHISFDETINNPGVATPEQSLRLTPTTVTAKPLLRHRAARRDRLALMWLHAASQLISRFRAMAA